MNDLPPETRKRKVLSLKKEPDSECREGTTQHFVNAKESVYMVFCPEGYMPKRVYRPGEKSIAMTHAQRLCEETGKRFFVMRAWRGFDPEVAQ